MTTLEDVLTVSAAIATAIATGISACVLVRQVGAMRGQLTVSALLDLHDKVFFGGRDGQNAQIIRRMAYNVQHPEDKRPIVDGPIDELDLDDYLGAYEMIQLLLEKDALDWDYVYHMFGYYI